MNNKKNNSVMYIKPQRAYKEKKIGTKDTRKNKIWMTDGTFQLKQERIFYKNISRNRKK